MIPSWTVGISTFQQTYRIAFSDQSIGVLKVKLMKFTLQQRLIRQLRLVLCDQGGRGGAAKGVFDDFVVFAGA